MPALARSLDALTPRWLGEVLRASGAASGGDPTVRRRQPIGTGQMSRSVRLRLAWPPGASGPSSVVCKLPSADPRSRETGRAMRTYEVEVAFYREVASTVCMRVPACHLAMLDPATHDFVLVLEDLAPARQGDQVAGCRVEEAALALDELAGLHAPRWADPRAAALPWLNRNSADELRASAPLLRDLLPPFLDRYGDRLERAHVQVATAFVDRLADWFAMRRPPFAIQHGDYRLDNMLFGTPAGGPPIAVVDWQTVTWGPPVADVAYFLGAGLPVRDRRLHERDLVWRYHEALCRRGVTDFPWERCWEDYRRLAPAGLLMTIGASMMVAQTERGDEMFVTMARRHAAHVIDLDALGSIGR